MMCREFRIFMKTHVHIPIITFSFVQRKQFYTNNIMTKNSQNILNHKDHEIVKVCLIVRIIYSTPDNFYMNLIG